MAKRKNHAAAAMGRKFKARGYWAVTSHPFGLCIAGTTKADAEVLRDADERVVHVYVCDWKDRP